MEWSISCGSVTACWQMAYPPVRQITRLSKAILRREARNKNLEQRLVRANFLLLLVSEDKDGSRTVSLCRYGHYDVRLVEIAQNDPVTAAKSMSAAKSLWVGALCP
jgi:hypothetical protein